MKTAIQWFLEKNLMSYFIPSNNHINAIVLAMVDRNIIARDEALNLMHKMRANSYALVSQYYQDGLIPQSLNDKEYPFKLDIKFNLSDEQIVGMIQSYQDNSLRDEKIDTLLEALLNVIGIQDVENFDLSNGMF